LVAGKTTENYPRELLRLAVFLIPFIIIFRTSPLAFRLYITYVYFLLSKIEQFMGNREYVDIKQEVRLCGEGSRVDSQHSQISGQTDPGKLNIDKTISRISICTYYRHCISRY
jgi:hypothetical protein